MWQEFQPVAAIATTLAGAKTLQSLCKTIEASLWVPDSLAIEGTQVYTGSLKEHLKTLWKDHRSLIFCMATGAVVRLIAPLLQHKSSDPAVVVIDEAGQYAISLCSGHLGGADQLSRLIACQLGAMPILTGAAVGLGLPGVDILGIPFGWRRGEGDWTGVSGVVARGESVQVIQEAGSTLWQDHLPDGHPFDFSALKSPLNPPNLEDDSCSPQDWGGETESPLNPPSLGDDSCSPQVWGAKTDAKAKIWISPIKYTATQCPTVQWFPRVLWVGIGCERGTTRDVIVTAIEQVLRENSLAFEAIAGIATIDIKADEVGLIQFTQEQNLPLRTFPVEVLRSLSVPNPSFVVEKEVGTPSVAEAAALQASGSNELLVTKQIYRGEGAGAVTVAIAQSQLEYTGRTGQVWLVGTGPGALEQITPAAKTAIAQADAIIGYSLYIDLIAPLLRPGQIVEALPITQEKQRSERAISLAHWGLTVAVISSGDCGIYGMAGLVLEELAHQGWDGKSPGVQVFPGITALQSAASRVGAPLMHDFCAISLSDLLTPWEVIEKRVVAAAQADFVTALYNPRSQTRIQQLAIAINIFLQYRHPETPVALVRSAYRDDEQVTLTTLNKLLEHSIDMLTTVLIGNSQTRTHAEWMITPRRDSRMDSLRE